MIRSLLIGMTAGSRSMTPLAIVSNAARRGALPAGDGKLRWIAQPAVAAAIAALAAGELLGDKLEAAPDRIVPLGLLARIVTGGLSGAALAPRRRALFGAAVGATAAIGAAYLTFGMRMRAMRRFGQTSTGVVEDALAVVFAQLVTSGAGRAR